MRMLREDGTVRLLVEDAVCNNAKLNDVLKNTQAYIILGPRASLMTYGFVTFPQTAREVDRRLWRRKVAEVGARVTSCFQLTDDMERSREERAQRDYSVWAAGLSSRGYEALGFPDKFPPEFKAGFAANAMRVAHSDPTKWNDDAWNGGKRYDMIIVLAARTEKGREIQQKAATEIVGVENVRWQEGFVERGDSAVHRAQAKEHFGFIDGVSQPEFFDYEGRPQQRLDPKFDPKSGLGLVMVPERFPSGQDGTELGSYMAFLKIEQHKTAFDDAATKLGEAMGCTSERAAAFIMGREANGAHLIPGGADPNDVVLGDNHKIDWPCASHVRKMDPRRAPHRRILRRGVLYREGSEIGLLFQSFQANLSGQFEVHLKDWANNPAHMESGVGIDPIAGGLCAYAQGWPGGANVCVSGLTTVKGGEYFYFPSIPALKAF